MFSAKDIAGALLFASSFSTASARTLVVGIWTLQNRLRFEGFRIEGLRRRRCELGTATRRFQFGEERESRCLAFPLIWMILASTKDVLKPNPATWNSWSAQRVPSMCSRHHSHSDFVCLKFGLSAVPVFWPVTFGDGWRRQGHLHNWIRSQCLKSLMGLMGQGCKTFGSRNCWCLQCSHYMW